MGKRPFLYSKGGEGDATPGLKERSPKQIITVRTLRTEVKKQTPLILCKVFFFAFSMGDE